MIVKDWFSGRLISVVSLMWVLESFCLMVLSRCRFLSIWCW